MRESEKERGERERWKRKEKKKKWHLLGTRLRERERKERKPWAFSIFVRGLNQAYFGGSRELEFSLITEISNLTEDTNFGNWYSRLRINSGIRRDIPLIPVTKQSFSIENNLEIRSLDTVLLKTYQLNLKCKRERKKWFITNQ